MNDECDCHFEDVLGPGYPLMRMALAHCPIHGDSAAQGRVQILPPTGELLPAEERLQNVLKAIEDRLMEEQEYVFALEENGLGRESGYHRRFVSGLDIAWSLAKTESLRTDGSGPTVAPSSV